MATNKKRKKQNPRNTAIERAETTDTKKKKPARNAAPRKKREKRSFIEYIKGVRLEMKKVVWPTKSELWSYAAVVVVACAFFAIAFWLIDTGFLAALRHLLGISM